MVSQKGLTENGLRRQFDYLSNGSESSDSDWLSRKFRRRSHYIIP